MEEGIEDGLESREGHDKRVDEGAVEGFMFSFGCLRERNQARAGWSILLRRCFLYPAICN